MVGPCAGSYSEKVDTNIVVERLTFYNCFAFACTRSGIVIRTMANTMVRQFYLIGKKYPTQNNNARAHYSGSFYFFVLKNHRIRSRLNESCASRRCHAWSRIDSLRTYSMRDQHSRVSDIGPRAVTTTWKEQALEVNDTRYPPQHRLVE